jgi:hypothetical protein
VFRASGFFAQDDTLPGHGHVVMLNHTLYLQLLLGYITKVLQKGAGHANPFPGCHLQ